MCRCSLIKIYGLFVVEQVNNMYCRVVLEMRTAMWLVPRVKENYIDNAVILREHSLPNAPPYWRKQTSSGTTGYCR